MPVILNTQVAEIRRIMVASLGKKFKTLSQNIQNKKGLAEWLK
jgi:hypothetical protein